MRVDTDQPPKAAEGTPTLEDAAPVEASGGEVAPAELLARHLAGDSGAFAELVARYRAPVYGYLVRSGVEPWERDDLFQEIFIRIHRASRSYERERPLHPWLFTIVCNAVRTYHRRRRVREIVRGASSAVPAAVAEAPDGERHAAARETVAWLEREIPTLPAAQREVLLLACVESMPLAEIATALRMPLNTVKTHLRRARLALAGRLSARGAGETR